MTEVMWIHDVPIAQRSHKKSSKGCRACKSRKIKCDEKKPVCGKCAIHYRNLTACDYGPVRKSSTKTPAVQLLQTSQYTDGQPSISHVKDLDPVGNETSQDSRRSYSEHSTCSSSPLSNSDTSSSRSSKGVRPKRTHASCPCPCQLPEFTYLMRDDLLGVCKVCGYQTSAYEPNGKSSPLITDASLDAGSVDPFSILPAKSSSRVHALAHHYSNTLALFPTKIHSQYCTNPTWLTQAINNETFFNATLYVSSIHDAGLRGKRGTHESFYFKAQTMRCLNKSLRDPEQAVSDETLAAVLLLTHIVSLIGEPHEAEIHMKGLRQMMDLRGGIRKYTVDGVFLHMLCIVNHLTAVISENPDIIPPNGIPYKPNTGMLPSHPSSPPLSPRTTTSDTITSITSTPPSPAETSPLLKSFAISIGFHTTVVDLLYDMEYLYAVVDVFTTKFLPSFRKGFEELVSSIELMARIHEQREKGGFIDQLKMLGAGDVANEGAQTTGVLGRN